jgi:hypothetical protein
LKLLGFLPLFAAIACAHAPSGSAARFPAAIQVDGTRVVVNFGEDDPIVVDQVQRVLPQAVRAAAQWGPLPASVTVTVHATHAELEVATGRIGNSWMRAWARYGAVDLQSPRTWSRGHASDAAMGQILTHELTHCVLFQAVGQDGRAGEIPIWFQEGMASVAAGEHHSLARADAVTGPAPLLRSDPRLVYGTADRAFRDLVLRHGERSVRLLLERLGEGHEFRSAFRDATGTTLADFEGDLSRRLAALTIHG